MSRCEFSEQGCRSYSRLLRQEQEKRGINMSNTRIGMELTGLDMEGVCTDAGLPCYDNWRNAECYKTLKARQQDRSEQEAEL